MALNGTMVAIQTVTVGSGGAANIEFTNIPQTYTDLVVRISARTNWSNAGVNADGVNIRPNGSTSNRTARRLYGSGSSAASDTNINPLAFTNASTTASTFGNAEIYIPNYTSSTNKSISVDGVSETNATLTYAGLAAFLWSNTAAITSLTLAPENGTSFDQHSTATLYGISRTTAQIKATGGMVYDTDTHVYHLFNGSGVFTPTQNLTVDYLVVAGGGGSGGGTSGGGGAGGTRSTVTSTGGGGSLETPLSLVANTSYTVTIGGGGTAGPSDGTNGGNGTNTVFGSITATGGGGGPHGGNGFSGGSGGGAGYGTASGGAASPSGQGFAGGSTTNSASPNFTGAGGGGAGAVGQSINASAVGGNGGNGIWTAMTNALQIGQLSAGNYFVAGGGAGTTNTGTAVGGLGGGGSCASGQNAQAGTANTGGGASGESAFGSITGGAAGGSGVVIVRYSK